MRASKYLPMIKKAMVDAGFGDVPVVSVTFDSKIRNMQPGFTVNWVRMLPVALTLSYSVTLLRNCTIQPWSGRQSLALRTG